MYNKNIYHGLAEGCEGLEFFKQDQLKFNWGPRVGVLWGSVQFGFGQDWSGVVRGTVESIMELYEKVAYKEAYYLYK